MTFQKYNKKVCWLELSKSTHRSLKDANCADSFLECGKRLQTRDRSRWDILSTPRKSFLVYMLALSSRFWMHFLFGLLFGPPHRQKLDMRYRPNLIEQVPVPYVLSIVRAVRDVPELLYSLFFGPFCLAWSALIRHRSWEPLLDTEAHYQSINLKNFPLNSSFKTGVASSRN